MTWHLRIENIAGIREGDATIEPGINAVRAANWRGKSSLIRAVQTAMGTATPLTEGAESGRVELATEGGRYTVELRRDDGDVERSGIPYLDDEYDAVCAELYAFLGEANEVRRRVREGANLEDVLVRPLDFENIDERIADVKRERERVDAELARAREAARRLPDVERAVTDLEAELDELEQRRAELTTDAEESGSAREELSQARAERSRLRERADRLEDAVDRVEARMEERRAEYDELDAPGADVAAELAAARDALEEVERDVELLRSVYAANKRVLDEDRVDLLTGVDRGLIDDTITCWVCGNDVEEAAVSGHLDRLGDRIADLRAEAEDRRERVQTLEDERETARQVRRRRDDLDAEIADLEATLADRRESLAEVRGSLAELDDRIADLDERVADAEGELTDVESEIKVTRADLEEEREELDEVTARADRRDALEDEHEELTAEIERLRTRKDDMKRRMREAFDEAIGDVLARFDTSFEGAHLTPEFDLVVARDGRQASLDALSEGELELLGFVAALAGHEAFEVADRVPVLLLDGLGGLADRNLGTLVEYLTPRAEYLVFTAYPEHTAFEGNEIDPTDWVVVSDESGIEAQR